MHRWHFTTTAVTLGFVVVATLFLSCSSEEPAGPSNAVAPSVTTSSVTNPTPTTAECGGNVTSDEGAAVIARGVCWSTSPAPTITDSKTSDGSGTGSFTSSLTGLSSATSYYVRAYATNSAGTGYGEIRSFSTTAEPTMPVVATSAVSGVTETTALCGGNVTSDGGADVTARGVCWSTNSTPTIADDHTTDGTETGSFTSSLTGLTSGTSYYCRAYATNSVGTGYGEERGFTTLDSTGTVTDIEGNVYQTIKIGDQWWMMENLKVTHYRNGDSIPNVTDSDTSTGAYCAYDNDENNVGAYGRLYNWYAVDDSRNIAPEGWHVPTDEEWQQMVDYLDGSSVAGGKLKDTGTTHWNSPNEGATNESGFSALPGGYRGGSGYFLGMGDYALFWSSTEYDGRKAWYRYLSYSDTLVHRRSNYKNGGLSVRCVRD